MKKIQKLLKSLFTPEKMVTPKMVHDFEKKFPGKDAIESFKDYGKREGHIK